MYRLAFHFDLRSYATAATFSLAVLLGAVSNAAAEVLVTNLDQVSTDDESTGLRPGGLAQAFSTGPHSTGYSLESIELAFKDIPPDTSSLSVSLWSTMQPDGSSEILPDTKLTDFTLNGTITNTGTTSFSAPVGTTLSADTSYAVVMTYSGSDRFSARYTLSTDEASSFGFTIRNHTVIYDENQAAWLEFFTHSLLIRVVGAEKSGTNAAPTLDSPLGNQTATAGMPFTYQFPDSTFSDPDGDALTYSATLADSTALPTWLSFDADMREFSGTPTSAGTIMVRVTATDGSGAAIFDEFDIEVIAAVLSSNADLSGLVLSDTAADTSILLSPAFDAATLTYTAATGSTANITLMPTTADSGATLAYEDGGGNALTDADGNAANGHQVDLPPQVESVVKVVITAGDGVTTKEYSVTVTRDVAATALGAAVTSTAPRFRQVTGANVRDVYGAGDMIEFTVTFSTAVDVDTARGVPTFTFSLGNANPLRTDASYARGSGSTTLVFAYPVLAADSDNNGIFLLSDADVPGGVLKLNGGVLSTGNNGVVSTTIATRGAQPNHKVNGSRSGPYVTSLAVTSTPMITRAGESTPDTYGAGETIEFTLTLSEAVTVTGAPHLLFSLNGTATIADYARGSGSDMLVFAYTVQDGDIDDNGIFLADQSSSGNSAVVVETGESIAALDDSAAADLVNPGRGTKSGHRVDWTATAPTVLSIVRQQPVGELVGQNGSSVTWRVTFSEDVTNVDAGDFTLSGTTATPAVTEVTASTVFDVTASGGNLANLNGEVVLGFAGTQNIEDLTGNALTVTIPSGDNESYTFDNTRPKVVVTVPASSTGPFRATFTFDEPVFKFNCDDGDVIVTNGKASDCRGEDGNTEFTAFITPTVNGDVTVSLDEAVAEDMAMNLSEAGAPVTSIYTAPNNAPTVANEIDDQAATVGTAFSFTVPAETFADVDGDTLAYSATLGDGTALPAWLSFDVATQEFSGTPTSVGTITVRVTATDGSGASIFDEFDIEAVVSDNANLSDLVLKDTVADSTISLSPAFDAATLTYTAAAGSAARITLMHTTAASGATAAYEDGSGNPLADADGDSANGLQVDLPLQIENIVKVVVTAEDGVTTNEYTVTVMRDAAAVVLGAAVTSTAPRFRQVNGANVRDVYGAGDVIEFTLTFSAAVDVDTAGGVPTFTFSLGNANATRREASYARGSGSTTLVFAYPVQVADSDNNGIFLLDDFGITDGVVKLNGGVLSAGTNGVVSTTIATRSAQPNHKVDGSRSGPYVTSLAVTSTPMITRAGESTPDTYGAGETIEFTLTLSEAVTVTGAPHLLFSLNGTTIADYARGSGSDMLVFAYTVQDGDIDDNGIFLLDQSSSGNSAVVVETGESIAALDDSAAADLVNPGRGTKSGHRVDWTATAPTVLSIVRQQPVGELVGQNGSSVTWRVTFSEDVTNVDAGDFTLSGTTATPAVTEVTASTVFDVTASGGDLANLNGEVVLGFAGTQNIEDLTGNALTVTIPSGGNESYTFDNTRPKVVVTVPATSTGPFRATFTFDEPVFKFNCDDGDVIVTNGKASDCRGEDGGTEFTAFITPTVNGDVTVSLDEAVAEDMAMNLSEAGAPVTSIYTAPNNAPTVANEIDDQAATVGAAFSFTVPAETFADVDGDTLTYSATLGDGTTLPAWLSFEVATQEFTGTPGAENLGTLTIRVTATDPAGEVASTNFDITTSPPPDTTAPTVLSIERRDPADSPTNADILTWRVMFSEEVQRVDQTDFAVTGTTATLTVVEVTASTVFDVTATGGNLASLDGTVTLGFSATQVIEDTAETPNVLSITGPTGTDDSSYVVDNSAPSVVSVTRQSPQTELTNADSLTWRVTFSEAVMNVDAMDFDVTGSGESISVMEIPDETGVWDVTTSGGILDAVNNNPAIVTLGFNANQDIEDAAGNAFPDPATEFTSFRHDNTAPTVVSIVRQTPVETATNADSLTWQVTFSDVVIGVDAADFAVSGTTATVAELSMTDDGTVWTVTFSGGDLAEFNGEVTLSFAAAQNIADAAGNALAVTAPTGANENSYVVDNARPTVMIGDVPPTSDGPFTATITFSEPVTGLVQSDIMATNATLSNLTGIPGGTQWTVDITPAANGQVTIDIGSDMTDDAVGNGNEAAPQVVSDYTAPNNAPTVAVAIEDQAATVGAAFIFTVPAETFADVDGDTLTYMATLGDGTVLPAWLSFEVATQEFTGTPGAENLGTLTIRVTATDPAGEVASTNFDITTSPPPDTTAPTVLSIERRDPAASPTSADSLTWRVTFSENVANVNAEAFMVTGTTATLAVVEVTAATVFDVIAARGNLASLDGTVTLGFAAKQTIEDTADTPNSLTNVKPSGVDEASYVVDNSAPSVVSVTRQSPQTELTNADSLTWRVTFSEAVMNVDAMDFDVTGSGESISVMEIPDETGVWDVTTSGGILDAVNNNPAIVTLGFNASQDIEDAAGNALPVPATEFTSFRHDNTAPTVVSIVRQTPVETATNADSLTWQVTFSDVVIGVDAADFAVSGTTATVAELSMTDDGTVWTVRFSGGDLAEFNGEVTLSFAAAQNIADAAGNALAVTAPTGANENSYVVDNARPTVMIGDVPPTSDGPFTATITFSEPVTGFVQSDIMATNATLSNLTGIPGGTQWTVDVTPAANGQVTIDIGSDVADDAVGNGNEAAPQAVSDYTAPNNAPTVAVAIENQAATVGAAFSFTVPAGTFVDIDGDTLTYSATLGGGTALPAWLSFEAVTQEFTGTPGAENLGTLTIRVTATDPAGEVASTNFDITTSPPPDTTAPTVLSIERRDPAASPTSADSLTWRVTFSENVANVNAEAFMVTGTTATLAVVEVTAATVFDVIAARGNLASLDGTVTLGFAAKQTIEDTADTPNSLTNVKPSGVDEASYVVDNSAPSVVSVTRQSPQTELTNADSLTWRVTFSEAVMNVDAMDFDVTGSGESISVMEIPDETGVWDVTTSGGILDAINNNSVVVSLEFNASQDIEDAAGNALPVPATEFTSFRHDNTAPTVVSIVRQTPIDTATNADSLTWQVTFSDVVIGVDAADFAVSGTTATVAELSMTDDGTVWTVTFSGGDLAEFNGEVTLSFAAAQNIADAAGNALAVTAPTGANENSYVVDNARPTVMIGDVPPTSDGPFTATITFSEPVTGFVQSDIMATNATLSNLTGIPGGTQWTVDVTPAANGQVTIDIGSDVADDAVGNGNEAAPQAVSDYTAPNNAPTVAVAIENQAATVGAAFSFTVPAGTFVDIDGDTLTYSATLGGGTALPAWLSFEAVTQEFTGTPGAENLGTLTIRVTATDPAGEVASTNFDITTSPPPDTTAPTVLSIERRDPAASPTNADILTWRVTFSEEVQRVDQTDFAVTGATATLTLVEVTASTVFDVTATGGNLADLDGTVTLGFAATQIIEDTAGNTLEVTTPTGTNDNRYEVDNTAPTLMISGVPGTSDMSFPVTFTFSEAVTGFTADDITVDNGTSTDFTGDDGTTTYTATITPAAAGEVTVSAAANAAGDAAGNGSAAATSTYSLLSPPEIEVAGLSDTVIADGEDRPSDDSGTNFGAVSLVDENGMSGFLERSFTIRNLGAADLVLSRDVLLERPSASLATTWFSITEQPARTIAAGESATFKIRFEPSTLPVAASIWVSIASNDADEGIYDFRIGGRPIAPELGLVANGVDLPDGGAVDFGELAADETSAERVITIRNTASGAFADTLVLGSDSVTISGPDAGEFTISTAPAVTSVAAGQETTFTIRYTPTGTGPAEATVTVNPVNGSPKDFGLSGQKDYGTPMVTLELSQTQIDEGDTVDIRARLDVPSLAETRITVSAVSQHTPPFDINLSSDNVLVIPVGATESTNTVVLQEASSNSVDDGVRTVTVSGSATNDRSVTGPDPVTLTVVDNDTPVDITAPTVLSIERQTPAASPTNVNSLTWRVTFSEDVQNVDPTDFTLSGTTATLTVVEATASAYDMTATGGNLASLDGEVTLGFASGQDITDTAYTPNTPNALSVTTPTGANDNSYVVDNTAPTVVSVTRQSPQTELTNADSLTWRVTFSEVVVNVDPTDFNVTGFNETISVMTVPGETGVWDVTTSGGILNEANDLTTVVLKLRGNVEGGLDIKDAAGNALPDPATEFTPFLHDNTTPTVESISRDSGTTPTDADALSWQVTFSEAVIGVGAADFAVSGTTATVAELTMTDDGTVWTVTFSGGDLAEFNGEVTLSFAAAQNIADAAGNALAVTAPTGANENSYVVDNARPTVMIGDVPPTSDGPFTATITFSEPVTGFVQSDIMATNATLSNLTGIPGGTQWTVDVTPVANGQVTIDIGSDVADDAVGNGNEAAPQAVSDYTAPNNAPTVAVAIENQAATVGAAFNFTVPAGTFVDIDGDTLTYSATLSGGNELPAWLSFEAATQEFTGTPEAENLGTLTVRVTATDPAGEFVSTEFDITVSPPADITSPTVLSIVRQTPAASSTNADSLTWRVMFSENVANVNAADFMVTGTTAPLAVVEATASTVFDVTATGGNLAALDGTVILGFASGQNITDRADIPNALSITTPTGTNDNRYVVDNTAPTVMINGVPATSSASEAPFPVTIEFSEPVTEFIETDITVVNATLSVFTEATDNETWTMQVTPVADGLVTLDIEANVVEDLAGNGNTSAPQVTSTYMANRPPTFSVPALTRSVAENAAPGTSVGEPIPVATDPDGDALSYRMEGPDASSFDFNATTRQIATSANIDYDFEARDSFSVTISADDGNGSTTTVTVTINLTDVDEPPTAPTAPAVTATSGSTTSLDASWAAPANDGRPAITSYDLRYCAGSLSDCSADSDFTNGPQDMTELSSTIPGLDAGTSYQVQVRASNADGDSGWSDSGSGNTAAPDNTAPTAENSAVTAVEDMPYAFAAADFRFADTDSGDGLTSVKITSLETAGNLELDGVAITTNQVVPKADIDGDRLTFTPAENANGTSYASFLFKVSDGADESIAAYTMTIDVDAVNDAPIVANGIANQSATVGTEFNFTVATDTFTDVDGDTLSYAATQGDGTALPTWLTFTPATRTFMGEPGAGDKGTQTVRVTVTDDDGESASNEFDIVVEGTDADTMDPLLPEVSAEGPNRAQEGENLVFTLTRTGDTAEPLTVKVAVTEGNGSVITGPKPETVDFEAGSATAEVVIATRDDGRPGSLTLVLLTVSTDNATVARYQPGSPLRQTVVVSDFLPAVSVEAPNPASEGDVLVFTLQRTGDVAEPLTVKVAVSESDGSVITGPVPDTVTFRAGLREAPVVVATRDDGREGSQTTVALSLLPDEAEVAKYQPASPSRQIVIVTDDGASAVTPGEDDQPPNPDPDGGDPAGQPLVVSVSDAQVREGSGATLDFVISLSRPAPPGRLLLVPFRTRNGSAVSGVDYIGLSGRTYIRPGETSTTLSIRVLDDDHDEGSETMTLTIFNPSAGRIGVGTATGTIVNSDPMPNAWLSRFGRTASDQTAQAIRRRIEGGPQDSHLTVGGRRLDVLWTDAAGQAMPHSLTGAHQDVSASLLRAPATDGWALQASGATGWHGFANSAAAGDSGSLFGPASSLAMPQSPGMGGDASGMGTVSGMGTASGMSAAVGASPATTQAPASTRRASSGGFHLPGARDLLLRSSFFYSQAADSDSGLVRRLSTWGEAATSRFSGAEDALNVDGEIATAIMGFDAEWGRWLAGVAVSHSHGAGGYSRTGSEGGTVASALTGVNPYVHYRLNERTSFWATLGYGSGSLTLQPANADAPLETGLSNAMAAVGGRGVLSMFDSGPGRFELALRSDALLTHTASDATIGLVAGTGATSRVRVLLEGKGTLPAFGGTLEPRLEAGLRHDAGDAERGAGFEIGGGLGWHLGPLSLDVGARTLLAHGNGAYEEWGYNAAVEYRPGADGRGLRLRFGSNWGADRSGVQQLWSQQTAATLVRSDAMPSEQRFEAEIGFGLGADWLWYPYAAADAAAGSRAMRLGLKLTSGQTLEAGLEFGSREQAPGNPPEEAILLQGRIRF